MNAKFRTEVITTEEGYTALEPEWRELAARAGSALGSWEWLDSCRHHIDPDFPPVIFVARDSSRVRAIAPMKLAGTGPIRRLVPLGDRSGEPAVFIYDDEASLPALSTEIVHFGQPLALTRFYAGAPELMALRGAGGSHGRAVYRESTIDRFSTSRVVLTGLDFETLQSRMSTSNRTYIRRKRGIAQREGTLTFEAVSPDETNVDEWMDKVLAVEGSGWKGRAGTSIATDETRLDHFRAFSRATARSGTLRLFFLRIGDAIAAARMNVEFGNRLWEFKIGYDERYSRASPGIVLMHDTLAWACSHGLDSYEFLGNYERWHTHWPSERYFFSTLYYYPWKASGLVALAHDSWHYARRQLAARREANSDIAPPKPARPAEAESA